MHECSLTFHNRKNTYFILGFVAILLYTKILLIFGKMSVGTTIVIAPPSALMIFGLLFFVFDQHVWKWHYFYKFGVITIPDISGVWKGKLNSSKDDKEQEVKLLVTQTYSKIIFIFDSHISSSQSKMAMIEKIGRNQIKLRWEYFAEPKTGIGKNNFRHYGVSMATIDGDGKKGDFKTKMKATYYTESERDSSGNINLTFIK